MVGSILGGVDILEESPIQQTISAFSFFHKNNQKFYKCGAARATAAGLPVRLPRGLAAAGFIIEREKAQMFYREK